MPDNEYKIPTVSSSVYEEALKYFIAQLIANKSITKKQADTIWEDAMGRLAREGVHEGLPYYMNALAGRIQPELDKQYQQKMKDWTGEIDTSIRNYYDQMLEEAKLQEGSRQWQSEQDLKERAFGWQQQEAKNEAQARAWEQLNAADRARWTAQAESSRFETERMMGIFRNVEAEREEIERQKKEMAWDAMRQDILSSVQGSPRSWIQTSRAANMQNPYTKSPETFQQNLETLREDYKQVKEAAKNVRSRLNDKDDSLTWQNIDKPQTTEDQMAAIVLNAEKDLTNKLNEANVAWLRAKGYTDASPQTQVSPDIQAEANEEAQWATPKGDEASGYTVGRPSTPVETRTKIPDWLQKAAGVGKFVPKTGTRVPILTPSGQSWSAMSPTQQQMYAGLVDVAGERTFEDIDWQRRQMLTQTPSLGRRWQPATQRV